MKKIFFLNEIAIVASNLFTEKVKDFNFEVVDFLDAWNQKIDGKINADYPKLAIKLWPQDSLKDKNNLIFRDKISGVLMFEVERSLDEYFSLESDAERENWLYTLLEWFVKCLPDKKELDGQELLSILKPVLIE